MKLIFIPISIIIFSANLFARDVGETKITTEDGIEVFQNEKFYLLKKNVRIQSDNFDLNADEVRVNFDKSLYDITELSAKGNVNFISDEYGIKCNGEFLRFEVKIEKLKIEGQSSQLNTKEIEMHSDGFIEIDNLDGNFSLKGVNSKLINENIIIKAQSIDGVFTDSSGKKEIAFLDVFDENTSYIKNNDTEMYAKKINFDDEKSIIELKDNVVIIRNEEKITGDYGTLDTINNSYKIKSNNKSKVKIIIQDND